MAKERTDASSYPSRYSPQGWVRADQYIIELICERRARSLGKDLPVRFWNLPDWAAYYKAQTVVVNQMLKVFEPRALINAIKDHNIWSLRAKWVLNVVRKEQAKLDAARKMAEIQKKEKATKTKLVDPDIIKGKKRDFRPRSRQSLLALDELDEGLENGEEESDEGS